MAKLNSDGNVVLTLDEFRQLSYDSFFLEELQSWGVDNWGGYDELDWNSVDERTDEEVASLEEE